MKFISLLILFHFIWSQSGLLFLTESYDATSLASASAYQSNQLNANMEFIPASLNLSEQKYLAASYQHWIDGIDVTSIRYATRLFNFGFAFHTSFYNISDIEQRNSPSTEAIGTFNNYNAKLGFSLSYQLTGFLHSGLTYKLIREKNAIYSAEGSAFDFNLLYQGRKLSAFLSYYNLGSMQTLKTVRSQLPETIAAGIKYQFTTIDAGLEFRSIDEIQTAHLFAQYQPISLLRLMGGYIINDQSRNWSFGMNIRFDQFELTYAYANHRYLNFYQNIQLAVSL